MKLTQVTMFYLPLTGGQETYIENLNGIFNKNQIETYVIQPYRRMKIRPKNVKMLPLIPKINKLFTDASWFMFNSLLFYCNDLLKNSDVIISHYPFHFPKLKSYKKVIVISHGVDWRVPAVTFVDKYRIHAVKLCRENGAVIVANDTDFLRYLGLNIEPGTGLFQEVEKNIWFIPNCVDIKRFKPGNGKRKNVILVPRNIRWVRGIHLAIESFKLFCEKNSGFVMHIAGGPLKGDYYRYCLDMIKKYGLTDKVFFIGNVPWQSIGNYYNECKITLIPTLELEGTSLSALESMACRTPVVSTNIGGLNDLPAIKADPIADKICEKLIEALGKWDDVSEYQYQKVTSVFNLENWEKAWLSVVNKTSKNE